MASLADKEARYYWQICWSLRAAEHSGNKDEAENLRSELEAIALHTEMPRLRALCRAVIDPTPVSFKFHNGRFHETVR